MTTSYIARPGEGRFQLDEEGIFNPLWGIGTLTWREVRDVFVQQDGTREYVCVVVRDRAALKARLGFLRRLFHKATQTTGFGDLTIDVARAGIQAQEVVEFASSMIDRGIVKKGRAQQGK
ncbi:MAG: hypothetical protein HY302_02765 [Opitutae bacterium]|nr:hypothetical protein [Opitutae bacterium]